MKVKICIQAIVVLMICSATISLFSQIGVGIVDGSNIHEPVDPPGGIGRCWDFQNQTAVDAVNERETRGNCDPVQFCELIYTCGAVPAAQQPDPDCPFIKTRDKVLVGNCNGAGGHKVCKECPAGSERLCMIYSFHRGRSTTGACQARCGWYQLHFSGNCVKD